MKVTAVEVREISDPRIDAARARLRAFERMAAEATKDFDKTLAHVSPVSMLAGEIYDRERPVHGDKLPESSVLRHIHRPDRRTGYVAGRKNRGFLCASLSGRAVLGERRAQERRDARLGPFGGNGHSSLGDPSGMRRTSTRRISPPTPSHRLTCLNRAWGSCRKSGLASKGSTPEKSAMVEKQRADFRGTVAHFAAKGLEPPRDYYGEMIGDDVVGALKTLSGEATEAKEESAASAAAVAEETEDERIERVARERALKRMMKGEKRGAKPPEGPHLVDHVKKLRQFASAVRSRSGLKETGRGERTGGGDEGKREKERDREGTKGNESVGR